MHKIYSRGNIVLAEYETDDLCVLNVYPAGPSLERGDCRISEHREEQVGNIQVDNKGSEYLLITDMDILSGAKQNRVINISTLIKPNSHSNLEVSCVEQDRWDYVYSGFDPSEESLEPDIREQKLLSMSEFGETKEYRYDLQKEIWNTIDDRITGYSNGSSTQNYESYLKKRNSRGSGSALPNPDKNSNGLAVFEEGSLKSLEVFGNPWLYQHYFPKIARHYLQGLSGSEGEYPSEAVALRDIYSGFCRKGEKKKVPGKNGVGDLIFRTGPDHHGFKLEYEGERIHEKLFFG